MSYNILLEELISNTGGCGKFQCLFTTVVLLCTTVAAWTMVHMTFNGQEPGFVCTNNVQGLNNTAQKSHCNTSLSSCINNNSSYCPSYQFDDSMHTVVSEWGLVCGRKWVVATITTIQMAGVLVGCFTAGHLGDLIGRKPTYFLSLLILITFNIVAYFSVSWEMYAAVRFILGLGVGGFLAVYRNTLVECATSIWRPRIMGVPSWSIAGGLLALVTWLCKDWKIIHMVSAAVGAPFLLTWWFVPESFRWLMTKGKYDLAEKTIDRVAKINGRQKPDIGQIIKLAKLEEKHKTRHHSAADLFKTKDSTIKTLALLFIWASISYAYYGLTFGLKNFAGNFYLNMFVTYAVEIPAELASMYSTNRFGRKTTSIVGLFFTAICGITNGVLQYVDVPAKEALINVFAVASKIGIVVSWLPIAVLSTETYPTVIRTTAVGVVNTAARVGGMIAPQVVFLNDNIPGMLFFLSGAVMVASGFLCFLFTETKGQVLEDTIRVMSNRNQETESNMTVVTNITEQTHNKSLDKDDNLISKF